MEASPKSEPMKGPYRRVDHGREAIRLIDACLNEETMVLDSLMQQVKENAIDPEEMEARITAFHQAFKLD